VTDWHLTSAPQQRLMQVNVFPFLEGETSMYITIERDRAARSSADGARFRLRISVQPGAPALLMSARLCQSVAAAKRDAEVLFGLIEWCDHPSPELRASALLGGAEASQ
jgi:hypothetical protein